MADCTTTRRARGTVVAAVLQQHERRYGQFQRTIALPTNVKPDQVACEFRNGLLIVTLPKAEEARPRRIQIPGGEQPRQIGGQARGLKRKASHSVVVRPFPAEVQGRIMMNGGSRMAQCEVCGNEYDKAFEVVMAGHSHVFDSFECAIHALAPTCAHCGCAIIGHGIEAADRFYCCAHCAEAQGVTEVRDRVYAYSAGQGDLIRTHESSRT